MPEEAERIREITGIDVVDYVHIIDKDGVNHVIGKHGEGKERKGVEPITKEDFYLIPQIVGNADEIMKGGVNDKGLKVIKYKKRINGDVYYLEEIRYGKKKLALVTFYKSRASSVGRNVRYEPTGATSETLYSQTPLKENIPDGAGEVKENLGEEPDVGFQKRDEKIMKRFWKIIKTFLSNLK
ncbi:MAG: hypothetical protein AB1656_01695 [Candidatus Omnitrophota bacterium]